MKRFGVGCLCGVLLAFVAPCEGQQYQVINFGAGIAYGINNSVEVQIVERTPLAMRASGRTISLTNYPEAPEAVPTQSTTVGR